MSVCKF